MFDTDVVLDLLLDREPFSRDAAALFARVENGEVEGLIAATSVTTVYYLAAKVTNRQHARDLVQRLLSIVDVAPVHRSVLQAALGTDMADFEDAVVARAALSAGAAAVITRNTRDYRRSPVPAHLPGVALAEIAALAEDDGDTAGPN